jgi:hypothetical protein
VNINPCGMLHIYTKTSIRNRLIPSKKKKHTSGCLQGS